MSLYNKNMIELVLVLIILSVTICSLKAIGFDILGNLLVGFLVESIDERIDSTFMSVR